MSIALSNPPKIGSGSPPPVLEDHEGGGGGSGWVRLVVAPNDIEAHLLAGRLDEAGITVHLLKDRSGPGAWLYGGANPWAPAAILVRRLQLDDARLVLAEISFEAPDARPGPGLLTARDWRTPVLWWSLALGLGLLLTGVALARTVDVVQRCDLPIVCGDAAQNGS
ncbi:MAG TPA: DUF2007 domain-containing protein [Actinomycetota bacterium]|nr:DUF2007 domain-containing protein [Actinomycetota bacterium]